MTAPVDRPHSPVIAPSSLTPLPPPSLSYRRFDEPNRLTPSHCDRLSPPIPDSIDLSLGSLGEGGGGALESSHSPPGGMAVDLDARLWAGRGGRGWGLLVTPPPTPYASGTERVSGRIEGSVV